MHVHALDSYRPGDSPLHRLDPRAKLALVLLLVVAAVLTPDGGWVAYGCLQVLLLAAAIVSRVGVGLIQRRCAVALPFTLAALTVVFSTPGTPLLQLPFLGAYWVVTDAGIVRFASVVVRSYLSVQAAVLLAASTPFPDLLWGMRALRVPRLLVAIGSFLYRYLFVLADEAQRLLRAREARSGTLEGRGGGSVAWRARVTGSMAGSLFIRSYERSERIYGAMLARGYDGEVRAFSPSAVRAADVVFVAVAAVLLALVVALARVHTWIPGL